jgi:hypothetical protein
MFWLENVLGGQFDPDTTPDTGDEYTLISWENWRHRSIVGSLNFQVKFLASGSFEYHFGTMSSSENYANGGTATSGYEPADGKAALLINADSSTSPGIAPNTGLRFTYAP